MVFPLSHLQSKTVSAMSMFPEKENYEELNQIGNGKVSHGQNNLFLKITF